MKAKIKDIQVFDKNFIRTLEEFIPDDPGCFGVNITVLFGPLNERGEEVFDFDVCTPQWLADQPLENGYHWGRHFLFVSHWDVAIITRAFNDLRDQSEDTDWTGVANRLSRYGRWEFEDYRDSL